MAGLQLQEHTTRDQPYDALRTLILRLSQASGASFLDQRHLLIVGHPVNVPEMLPTTLGTVLRSLEFRRWDGRG